MFNMENSHEAALASGVLQKVAALPDNDALLLCATLCRIGYWRLLLVRLFAVPADFTLAAGEPVCCPRERHRTLNSSQPPMTSCGLCPTRSWWIGAFRASRNCESLSPICGRREGAGRSRGGRFRCPDAPAGRNGSSKICMSVPAAYSNS